MGKALARLAPAAVVAVLVIGLSASPSRAHNDWGLPLVGGLVGGYGLSYMMNRDREPKPASAGYVAPPPAAYVVPAPVSAPPASAASTAASVEHQLNVLDDLAAKGYITKDEYQSRRQALLNQL
jgi:uncharacterized membrane protein